MSVPNKYSNTENLLRLLTVSKNLSPQLRTRIDEKAQNFLNHPSLKNDVATFLNEDMDSTIHSEEDIRTLVQVVPESLTVPDWNASWFREEERPYPIQNSARSMYTACFTPILAEEAISRDVFADGSLRGGLLRCCSDDLNALEKICKAHVPTDTIEFVNGNAEILDKAMLDVLVRLRNMGLFKKSDVRNYQLLYHACSKVSSLRFKYLVKIDPDALKCEYNIMSNHLSEWSDWSVDSKVEKSLLHCVINSNRNNRRNIQLDRFRLTLEATLYYFPHDLGLLLTTDDDRFDTTPYRLASESYGYERTWAIIEKCLMGCDPLKTYLETRGVQLFMLPAVVMDDAAGDVVEKFYRDDGDSELDLIYQLLRRDPNKLEHILTRDDKICCKSRKRKIKDVSNRF